MKLELLKRINKLDSKNKEIIISLIEECLFFKIQNDSNTNSRIGEIQNPLSYLNYNRLKLFAKIDLDDINFINEMFPKKGFLLFYINDNDLGYRFPYFKNEYKIVYCNDDLALNEFNKTNKPNLFIEKNESFPSYQEYVFESNKFENSDLEVIDEIVDFIQSYFYNDDYDLNHQILGHPNALQGSVKFWWSLSYFGYKIEDVEKLNSLEMEKIRNEEENFILLLQINFGDPNVNIGSDIFGDSVAYFGIHKTDLKRLDFEKVVLIIQNT